MALAGLILATCASVARPDLPALSESPATSPTSFQSTTPRPAATTSTAPDCAATATLDPDEPVYEDDPSAPPAGSFGHARVTGAVTDADGRSLTGATILTEPSPIIEIAPIQSRSDGSFDLARYGLPPGRYKVTARLEGYHDASVEVDARTGPVHVDQGPSLGASDVVSQTRSRLHPTCSPGRQDGAPACRAVRSPAAVWSR